VIELYENFIKFNKLEVQHFLKLEQQRKAPKHDEASRPTHYNNNQHNYPKHVHNIDSDGCGPPKNWEKNFRSPPQERSKKTFDHRSNQYNQRGGTPGLGRGPFKHLYYTYHGSDNNHRTKDCPIFLESKRKMEQYSNQTQQQSSSRLVNHTLQWAPPHHQYSSSYPSLIQLQTHTNNQGQALTYYKSFYYATTNHI
jgi:hypothetical protein